MGRRADARVAHFFLLMKLLGGMMGGKRWAEVMAGEGLRKDSLSDGSLLMLL